MGKNAARKQALNRRVFLLYSDAGVRRGQDVLRGCAPRRSPGEPSRGPVQDRQGRLCRYFRRERGLAVTMVLSKTIGVGLFFQDAHSAHALAL